MMQIIKVANDLLQRIADFGNWLTYDETSAVRDEYNAVVSVFMCLDRTLRYNFGGDNINTERRDVCPKKKTVLDFIKWSDDGKKLVDDLMKFLVATKLNFMNDTDKKYVYGSWNKIRTLYGAVLNMGVTVPKKEEW